ncbi:MAG: CPBP family intramembrane metalloprotease [Sphingomonadales bacterium]|nr:CPBP family intramembrane metalloprotease [Sphingomonadales bacterium]
MTEVIHPDRPGLLRRIVSHPGALIVLEGGGLVLALSLASTALHALHLPRNAPITALVGPTLAIMVILTYTYLVRWLERRPALEFAWPGAARELGLGLLTGTALFSIATLAVWMLGGIEFLGVRGMGQLWSMIVLAFISGFFEETLFRGIVFRHVETMFGTWAALALTSAFFGAAHIFNPDATWFSAFAIMLEAGILLGAAYLLTRRLWLAIGIHMAWNFTQGWVFSIPVSGGEVPLGLLITRRIGPDWLTGGAFGLEASAVAVAVATLAGVLLLRRAIQRDGTRPPFWVTKAGSQTKL